MTKISTLQQRRSGGDDVPSGACPIVVLSGPPGAGKSVVAIELAKRFALSYVLPVDELRLGVVSGLSEPLPEWTSETERQFRLAEDSAPMVARNYNDAGFMVILDHCRLPQNIDAFVSRCFFQETIVRVAIVPSLETNLARNAARKNKAFDPTVLEPVIRGVNEAYHRADLSDWIVIANEGTIDEAADTVVSQLSFACIDSASSVDG